MKNLFLFSIFTLFFISCDVENIEENKTSLVHQEVNLKRAVRTPPLAKEEHQRMLELNSFIVSELILWSAVDRALVLNSIDPVTKTVSMNYLLNPNINAEFVKHYTFVASRVRINLGLCTNPDDTTWPPFEKTPEETSLILKTQMDIIPAEIQLLINNLKANRTELYIPNDIASDNFYPVGHPLENLFSNTGSVIYSVPLQFNNCIIYSEAHTISISELANDYQIVLSRPDLSTSNPYTYINFDIEAYLEIPPGSGVVSYY